MNVLPQDLGEKRCEMIVSQRAGTTLNTRQEQDASLGFWGRRWLGKLKTQITPKEARPVLQAARASAGAWTCLGLLPAPAAIGGLIIVFCDTIFYPEHIDQAVLPALAAAGVSGVWGWLLAIVQPRRILRKKYRRLYQTPVSGAEIAFLLPQTHDELERSYLTLVMDVSRQEV